MVASAVEARPMTTDPSTGRVAPWSPEAEQAVLGAMLLDHNVAVEVAAIRDGDALFYSEEHRRLYRAMRALVECGSTIDPVTLNNELERREELHLVGGSDYVGEIVDATPSAAGAVHHLEILIEKRALRLVIDACTQASTTAYEAKASAVNVADLLVEKLAPVAATPVEEPEPEATWPVLDSAALHGPLGHFVETVATDTEAHPAGLLLQTLACFGNIVG